ncbi:hypothetical protein BH09VER1_BH09VER1_35450 [soil metagenome]
MFPRRITLPIKADARLTLAQRISCYLLIWFLAALALQIFLKPEDLTETSQSPVEQRFWWVPLTPILLTFGLMKAFSLPLNSSPLIPILVASCLLAHASFTLTRRRILTLAWLLALQFVLLAIAVIGYVHLANLPCGP